MNGQRKIQRRETLRAKTAGEIPKMFVQTSPEDYSLAALIILGTNHTKKTPPNRKEFCCRSGPTRTGDRLHPMQEC